MKFGPDMIMCFVYFAQPPADLTILQLERNLRTMVDKLNMERHDRIKRVKRLKEDDQHYCDILHTTPYYIPTGCIPSEEKIEELANHVENSRREKVRSYILSLFHYSLFPFSLK